MRVIAGLAKGKKLKAPGGKNTRPITDMIKEALFNVLGTGLTGAVFLDLFAGSGSVGIEAISRGASQVIFIDNSPQAVAVIDENLTNCGFHDKTQVFRQDVFRAVAMLEKRSLTFDFIYIDPPFDRDIFFNEIMSLLGAGTLLAEDGLLILRSRRKKLMADRYDRLSRWRMSAYGESVLHYYRVDKEEKGNDGDLPSS